MALFRVVFLRVSLAAVGLAVTLPAWSQSSSGAEISLAEIARRSVEARYGRMSEQWQLRRYPGVTATPGASGSVVVAHPLKGPGPAGVIDVEARVIVPKSNIAKALLKGLPIIGAGITGAEILSEILDDAGIGPGPGGTVIMDPGAPQSMQENVRFEHTRNASGNCPAITITAPDAAGVASQMVDYFNDCGFGDLQGNCSGGQHSYQTTWETFSIVTTGTGANITILGTRRTPAIYSCTVTSAGVSQGPTAVPRLVINEMGCPGNSSPAWWDVSECVTPVDNWEVVDEGTALDRVTPRITGSEVDTWRALDGAQVPIEGSIPTVVGPIEIPISRERTENPDGSVTVKDTWSPIEYGPIPGTTGSPVPGYRWGERIETRTYPPGETVPELGQPGGGTPGPVVITDPGAGTTGDEIITCGLPWTPPCKINEEGTPTADPDTSQEDAQGIIADLAACLADPVSCLPTLPDLSWSFSLPSSCSPISMPGFAEDVPSLASIDICQFQSTIHDLASLLWAAAGLFGAVRLVGREAFGSS